MKQNSMTRCLAAFSLAALAMTCAHAADASKAQPASKTSCKEEAGDRKGAERKTFMKTCLATRNQAQREKMKQCNADATGKKGDERKQFMRSCLSKQAA
jgi:hypothetical protein